MVVGKIRFLPPLSYASNFDHGDGEIKLATKRFMSWRALL